MVGLTAQAAATHKKSEATTELRDETKFTLEEGRMTLPGIQALFGFQLISVFSPVFDQQVAQPDKVLHLVAIGLTVISIALTMTPAAYDRQTKHMSCTKKFIRIASTCITVGMLPLAISMSLELYVISFVITKYAVLATTAATVALLFFLALWFVFPFISGRKHS